jgi:hypothetical protein
LPETHPLAEVSFTSLLVSSSDSYEIGSVFVCGGTV